MLTKSMRVRNCAMAAAKPFLAAPNFQRHFSRRSRELAPFGDIADELSLSPFGSIFSGGSVDPFGGSLLRPFSGPMSLIQAPQGSGRFLFDMTDEDDAVQIQADLPGMKQEDIKVHVEGRQLVIEGERHEELDVPKKKKEIYYGKIRRSLMLPQTVDTSETAMADLKATLKDGVLKLTFQKLQGVEGRGHTIEVTAE